MSERRWQDRLSADDYRREDEAMETFNRYARERRIGVLWCLLVAAILVCGILVRFHFFP